MPTPHPLSTEVDHIVPLAEGGHPFASENLRAVHRKCNRDRATVAADEHPERNPGAAPPGTWHPDGLGYFCRREGAQCYGHSRNWHGEAEADTAGSTISGGAA